MRTKEFRLSVFRVRSIDLQIHCLVNGKHGTYRVQVHILADIAMWMVARGILLILAAVHS